MTAAEKRHRFDKAFEVAAQAMARLTSAFNKDDKVQNLILARAYLDSACNVLGQDLLDEAFEDDPDTLELVAHIKAWTIDTVNSIKPIVNQAEAARDNVILTANF